MSLRRWFSRLLNWATGGSYDEYYCDRLEREGRADDLYYINWLIFYMFNDPDHYNRVKERTRKDV